MNLSTFRARVRREARDIGSAVFYEDDLIENVLDDWVRENWPEVVRKVPRFYLDRQSYTGITDAVAGTNDEVYTLPATFRAFLSLRRTDTSDKPLLRFVQTKVQDAYRFLYQPFYETDSPFTSSTGESWSFYTATQFQIIPAPTATTFTYEFLFLHDHSTPIADGDTVDIPDEALSLAINDVVAKVLARGGEVDAGTLNAAYQAANSSRALFQRVNPATGADIVPNSKRWW